MDKHTIVRTCFERGILLSPAILDTVADHHLPALKPNDDVVVTSLPEAPGVSVAEIASFYQEKYKAIQTLLLEKLTPISLNNATKQFGEISVIGMVQEHLPGGFILEDPTGSVDVRGDRPAIGDVVGVVGYMKEGTLVMKELQYPDIPLPKEVVRLPVTVRLTPTQVQASETQVVSATVPSADGVVSAPPPSQVEVNGARIIVADNDGDPIVWLRKRHLPDSDRSHPFIIEKIPHLLWKIGTKNQHQTYKGVMVVETDQSSSAQVNFFSHTVEFT